MKEETAAIVIQQVARQRLSQRKLQDKQSEYEAKLSAVAAARAIEEAAKAARSVSLCLYSILKYCLIIMFLDMRFINCFPFIAFSLPTLHVKRASTRMHCC